MLIEKHSREEQIGIGVVKVLDHKLFCGPVGNYNPKFSDNSPLEKAKYTLTVCRPDEPAFHEDYEKMFSNLGTIQSSISYGNDQRNMLDNLTRTIRFSVNVFEERVGPMKPNHYALIPTDPSPQETPIPCDIVQPAEKQDHTSESTRLTDSTVYLEDYDHMEEAHTQKEATEEKNERATQGTSSSSDTVDSCEGLIHSTSIQTPHNTKYT
jgi:hypothetical protein